MIQTFLKLSNSYKSGQTDRNTIYTVCLSVYMGVNLFLFVYLAILFKLSFKRGL